MPDQRTGVPAVLLPLRAPGSGLTRLAGTLGADQRAALATAMLADVVAALRTAGLDRLTALTAGPAAAAVARRLDLSVRPDPDPAGAGLDTAVTTAVAGLPDAAAAAVVMPDLPLLGAGDVRALLATEAGVVVAPTGDGGTGALLLRPAGAIHPAFGPGSAARHLDLARRSGRSSATVHRPGLTSDLDTLGDLRRLSSAPDLGARTRDVLDRLRAVPG